jgi:hypothetical protein
VSSPNIQLRSLQLGRVSSLTNKDLLVILQATCATLRVLDVGFVQSTQLGEGEVPAIDHMITQMPQLRRLSVSPPTYITPLSITRKEHLRDASDNQGNIIPCHLEVGCEDYVIGSKETMMVNWNVDAIVSALEGGTGWAGILFRKMFPDSALSPIREAGNHASVDVSLSTSSKYLYQWLPQ